MFSFSSFLQEVKLSPQYEVFITDREMKDAKTRTSASSLARFLVKKVFTKAALHECTVSGKKPANSELIRPPFHQDGISDILGTKFSF